MDELTEAVLNSNLDTTMKSLAVVIFNAYMEAERDEHIQADYYERNGERADYRNGYYEREYTMSIGKINLKVPRTRSGEFSTKLFKKYQRMDQAFVLSMVECVINGVSTRKVSNIVEQLCGESVSKSFVSNALERIDPELEKFQNRSLTSTKYRYIYVDAMYIKVREDHRIVSKAVYIAIGVNDKNKREIIGFTVDEEESYEAWADFFQSMRRRGLQQPKMIISDAHAGLKKAINEIFLGTTWQRCTFHFLRNITDKMPKKDSKKARHLVKKSLYASSEQEAREFKAQLESEFQENKRYEEALRTLDEGFDDAIQYLEEPQSFHISLRTTNCVERLNQEVRRREQVIRIFPNTESALRLIGAVLMDYQDKWDSTIRPFLKQQEFD
jgi:transposase-like protein